MLDFFISQCAICVIRLWVSILQRQHSGLEPRQIRAPTQVGCALFLIPRRYAGGLRHKHAWSETRSGSFFSYQRASRAVTDTYFAVPLHCRKKSIAAQLLTSFIFCVILRLKIVKLG